MPAPKLMTLTDAARDFLIEKGYNPDFGARPLKRAIEHLVEDPLAEEVLRGAFGGKKAIDLAKADAAEIRSLLDAAAADK